MTTPCTAERLARCKFVNQHTLTRCMCLVGVQKRKRQKTGGRNVAAYWLAQAAKWSPESGSPTRNH